MVNSASKNMGDIISYPIMITFQTETARVSHDIVGKRQRWMHDFFKGDGVKSGVSGSVCP